MNGVHDIGGMHGFGPIEREEHEPIFHADWERALFAVQRSAVAQGWYNIDEFRYARERMDPAAYLALTYHERSLASIETLLHEKGLLSREEIDARAAQLAAEPTRPLPSRSDPELLAKLRGGMSPAESWRATTVTPRFAPGDQVLTRNMHPHGHTRLPRYARAKPGTILMYQGLYPLADVKAEDRKAPLEPIYSVEFEARTLWGDQAGPRDKVYLDLAESYLEPA